MSGEFQITDGAARRIAASHDDAASAIEETAQSLPPCGIDGGEAAGVLTEIIGKVVGDCSALARANRSAAAIMRQIASDYCTTEDMAASSFDQIAAKIDVAPRQPTAIR